MMLVCMYLLSTKLDFPKKIEQFSKALLEISMMMLFSETSRFRLLLIMYYLQKYVFIDHTNSMMQINDTHQIFGFLIGLSKLVYGLYCSREHRFCKKNFFFFYKQICFLMALAFHVVSHIYVIYVCIAYTVTLNCKNGNHDVFLNHRQYLTYLLK